MRMASLVCMFLRMRMAGLVCLVFWLIALTAADSFEEEGNDEYNTIDRSGGSVSAAAANKLEQQFLYLISAIAEKIDPAIASIKADQDASNVRAQSYGLAMVAGGFKDSAADFIGNNRLPQDILTMPDVVYSYGYNIGYGFGFGGPFLLPTYLTDTRYGCSRRDFLGVVSRYGLGNGLNAHHTTETQLVHFGVDSKLAVHCLLKNSGDYAEAAEVGYLIDDMVEAGIQAIRLSQN